MTRYEEEFYHNIERLTNGVEEIAKKLDKNSEMSLEQAYKVCADNNVACFEMNYYHKVIAPALDMLNFLREKMNEDYENTTYRTEVTIKLGFTSSEEYKKFEDWLESNKLGSKESKC